jgi:hypothetical protein
MLIRLIMLGAVPPADAVGITVTVSTRPKPGFALGTPATFCGDGAAGVDDCVLGAGCGTMITWGGAGCLLPQAASNARAAREADTETIVRMKPSLSVCTR